MFDFEKFDHLKKGKSIEKKILGPATPNV